MRPLEIGMGRKQRLKARNKKLQSQRPRNPSKGNVRKLTDYFNKLGGPKPSRAPKTPIKTPKTPARETSKSGAVIKAKRKGKIKIEEPQRKKMENALRNFLKKPPDK